MEENNNFLYKGYLLVIKNRDWFYDGICKELNFGDTSSDTDYLKKNFMKFVDEKLQKENNQMDKTPKGMFVYKGYLLEIILDPTLKLCKGVCKELNLTMVEEVVENLQDRFISYINSWRLVDKSTEDKDRKIEELIKVIDGLNKKLEEKDNKIERLKNKIATVKLEINKAE